MDLDLIQATRVTLAILMLAGAGVLDLRTRRVPNGYWLPFVVAATALLVVDAGLQGWEPLLVPLVGAVAVAAFAYLAWRLRLFGGADAKALMVLAALVPTLPASGPPAPFALDTLMNGTLAAALAPLAILAGNLARGDLRFPAAFIGRRMPLQKARRLHVWPMQWVAEDGAVRWRYWGFVGLDAEPIYDRLAASGLQEVWVTAKVPLAALLAVGAAVAAVWGNLMLHLAQALLGSP